MNDNALLDKETLDMIESHQAEKESPEHFISRLKEHRTYGEKLLAAQNENDRGAL